MFDAIVTVVASGPNGVEKFSSIMSADSNDTAAIDSMAMDAAVSFLGDHGDEYLVTGVAVVLVRRRVSFGAMVTPSAN